MRVFLTGKMKRQRSDCTTVVELPRESTPLIADIVVHILSFWCKLTAFEEPEYLRDFYDLLYVFWPKHDDESKAFRISLFLGKMTPLITEPPFPFNEHAQENLAQYFNLHPFMQIIKIVDNQDLDSLPLACPHVEKMLFIVRNTSADERKLDYASLWDRCHQLRELVVAQRDCEDSPGHIIAMTGKKILSGLPTTLQKLALLGEKMIVMGGALDELVSLVSLRCFVPILGEPTGYRFAGFTCLRKLDLSGASMGSWQIRCQFPQAVRETLQKLRCNIGIDGLRVEVIGTLNNLRSLGVYRVNTMQRVENGTRLFNEMFRELVLLEKLEIEDSHYRYLPEALSCLTGLRELSLRRANYESLHTLLPLTNIKSLRIQDCLHIQAEQLMLLAHRLTAFAWDTEAVGFKRELMRKGVSDLLGRMSSLTSLRLNVSLLSPCDPCTMKNKVPLCISTSLQRLSMRYDESFIANSDLTHLVNLHALKLGTNEFILPETLYHLTSLRNLDIVNNLIYDKFIEEHYIPHRRTTWPYLYNVLL